MVRDLIKIQSEAYRAVEGIRGAADAAAAAIYAGAYNVDAVSVEFYDFTRTVQAYGDMITDDTTLVLTTDSDLFKFLRGMRGETDPIRNPSSVPSDSGLGSIGRDLPTQDPTTPIVTQTGAEAGR